MVPSAVNFLYCADSSYSKEILQADMCFRLLPETLHLAVNIIDRFLPARVMSLAKLQLVGIRCVFLGSWHHLQSISSTVPTHCIQRSFRQTCASASSHLAVNIIDCFLSACVVSLA